MTVMFTYKGGSSRELTTNVLRFWSQLFGRSQLKRQANKEVSIVHGNNASFHPLKTQEIQKESSSFHFSPWRCQQNLKLVLRILPGLLLEGVQGFTVLTFRVASSWDLAPSKEYTCSTSLSSENIQLDHNQEL